MKTSARCIAVVIALMLLAAPPALARHHPTASQRAAIAERLAFPPRCAIIWISSVSSSWASFSTSTRKSCVKYAANGVTILHHKHFRWHQVTAGSEFSCPVPHTPANVVADLRIPCSATL